MDYVLIILAVLGLGVGGGASYLAWMFRSQTIILRDEAVSTKREYLAETERITAMHNGEVNAFTSAVLALTEATEAAEERAAVHSAEVHRLSALQLTEDPYNANWSEKRARHYHRYSERDEQGIAVCPCGDRYLDEVKHGG